jgi:hypothetical protein
LRYNIRINNAKENMTTYTLPEAEILALKEMVAYGFPEEALTVLRSLKPNLQEPVGFAGNMPGTDGFTMACFKAVDVPVGAAIYTHPAPISKEDMVKVLEALQGNRVVTWQEKDGAWSLSKEITPAPTLEAITIMQSAIEGMK